ncbi:MAG: hypothetical protein JST26_13295 [Bacteroidetes bacterium]|nr:hypothetical protein [Bacteroidota bacterium]
MKKLFYIPLLFVLLNCSPNRNSTQAFKDKQTLENLSEKDTLLIVACIHHECGGEWGGCLEQNKIYRQGNSYAVKFTNGITVWNGDTIIDPKKINSLTKTLTDTDISSVNEFLHQVSIFSDSLALTSNGPNYYEVKTNDYKKNIEQDYDQWLWYQRFKDNIYK